MTNNDLKTKVHKWLNDQGYPLEMQVAKSFLGSSYKVTQSYFYTDPENSDSREIDVVASYSDHLGHLTISLIFECKSCKDKPWILFTSESSTFFGNRVNAFAVIDGFTRGTVLEAFRNTGPEEFKFPWFNKHIRNGYGISAVFNNGGGDVTYTAIMSVLKASIAIMRESSDDSFPRVQLNFPIIVTDSPLFEAYMNENGEIKLNEITDGYLSFYKEISNYEGTFIHIISSKHLSVIVKESEELIIFLKNKLGDILSEWERLSIHDYEAYKKIRKNIKI
jgi:hypothetical protein